MKRFAGVVVGALLVVVAAACVPPPVPSPPAPYLDQVYTNVTVTPKATGVAFGSAPAVDPKVGTPNDTHGRVVDASGSEVLHLWVANPVDNAATNRPAIIWVHGGGFVGGIGSEYSLAAGAGLQYAKRGYVGFSIEYRIDTTSQCQYVQDHQHDVPLPPGFDALRPSAPWHHCGGAGCSGCCPLGAPPRRRIPCRPEQGGDRWVLGRGGDGGHGGVQLGPGRAPGSTAPTTYPPRAPACRPRSGHPAATTTRRRSIRTTHRHRSSTPRTTRPSTIATVSCRRSPRRARPDSSPS